MRGSGSVCTCQFVCVCMLGVRIGQRWKQKQEQGHNTCALRCVVFIISLSARDPCNSAWGCRRRSRWGRMPAIDFPGWQQTTRKVDWKANWTAPASILCALSLSLSLSWLLSLDMLWGGFVASFFQPSSRENGKVILVLRVMQPTVLPVSIPSGICLASSHGFLFLLLLRTPCPPQWGACAPRIVVYVFAVTIALWMLCGSLGGFQLEAHTLPGGQRYVSAHARHIVPVLRCPGIGRNASTWRRAPCWRSFDLDLAALMQLPQHLLTGCLRVLAALPEVRFVFIVLALYDVPVLLVTSLLSNCLSVRPSVCPPVRF